MKNLLNAGFAIGVILVAQRSAFAMNFNSPTESASVTIGDGDLDSLTLKTPTPGKIDVQVEESHDGKIEIYAILAGEDKAKAAELKKSYDEEVNQRILGAISNGGKDASISFGGVTEHRDALTISKYSCNFTKINDDFYASKGACLAQITVRIPKDSKTRITLDGKPIGFGEAGKTSLSQLGEQLDDAHFSSEKFQAIQNFIDNNPSAALLVSDVAKIASKFDFENEEKKSIKLLRHNLARQAPAALGPDLIKGFGTLGFAKDDAKMELLDSALKIYASGERVLSVEDIASLASDVGAFKKLELVHKLEGRATNPEKAYLIRNAVDYSDREQAEAALAQ